MVDFIIIAIILVIIGSATIYILKAKKSGVRCIGCPAGGNCSCGGKESSGCGCCCSGEEKSGCDCHADIK